MQHLLIVITVYILNWNYCFNNYFFFFFLGNQGIATGLYKISQEFAFENNYKNVFTISTGPISQHIRIKKLGFVIVDEIAYKTFLFNQSYAFAQIEQVDTCKSLVKIF